MVRQKIYKPITKKSGINAQHVKQIRVYFMHNVEIEFFLKKKQTSWKIFIQGLKKYRLY